MALHDVGLDLDLELGHRPGIDGNGSDDIYPLDRFTGETEIVSVSAEGEVSQGGCISPSISDGGRYVAFLSAAPDLVPGGTNAEPDVFVRDRLAGTLVRASVRQRGGGGRRRLSGPAPRRCGRHLAFHSRAANLAPGDAGTTVLASVSAQGLAGNDLSVLGSLSADGRLVAFESNATNIVPAFRAACAPSTCAISSAARRASPAQRWTAALPTAAA